MDAAANSATAVVGEDTDLLVVLCLHADVKSQPPFFKSEKKQKNHKVWHINRLKSVMGPELCLLLPFVHAVSGSDTIARQYGVGKGAALLKLRSDSAFKEAVYVFIRQLSLEEIDAAGEKAFCALYRALWAFLREGSHQQHHSTIPEPPPYFFSRAIPQCPSLSYLI